MKAEHAPSVYRTCTVDSHRLSVERVIVAMRERLDEPLTLRDMSKIAYSSPFHFNRIFHQITGIPPTQFLYALRLETAKRLLLQTEHSVTEICFEVGYNSLGTFTTRFTQLVGLSPCSLRRLADQFKGFPTETILNKSYKSSGRNIVSYGSHVIGRVNSPSPTEGIIFVGLFPSMIPQSRPAGGTLLTAPGSFCIGPVPDGLYHLFAAAFPRSTDPMAYLLPDSPGMLVGVNQVPIMVRDGRVTGCTEMSLRPVSLTDPPILIALLSLLVEVPGITHNQAG